MGFQETPTPTHTYTHEKIKRPSCSDTLLKRRKKLFARTFAHVSPFDNISTALCICKVLLSCIFGAIRVIFREPPPSEVGPSLREVWRTGFFDSRKFAISQRLPELSLGFQETPAHPHTGKSEIPPPTPATKGAKIVCALCIRKVRLRYVQRAIRAIISRSLQVRLTHAFGRRRVFSILDHPKLREGSDSHVYECYASAEKVRARKMSGCQPRRQVLHGTRTRIDDALRHHTLRAFACSPISL